MPPGSSSGLFTRGCPGALCSYLRMVSVSNGCRFRSVPTFPHGRALTIVEPGGKQNKPGSVDRDSRGKGDGRLFPPTFTVMHLSWTFVKPVDAEIARFPLTVERSGVMWGPLERRGKYRMVAEAPVP